MDALESTTDHGLAEKEIASVELAPPIPGSGVQVFQPVPVRSPSSMDNEEEPEPFPDEIRASQAALIRKSKVLNERGFTLAKDREEEKKKAEKARMDKWPNTLIRLRFSDGTQIQNSFASTSKIGPVYEFVRSSLAEDFKSEPFILYQPPAQPFPELPPTPQTTKGKARAPPFNQPPPVIKSTLFELQLVPQSVLLVKFENEGLNKSDSPAPLLPSLLQQAAPLPPQEPRAASEEPSSGKAPPEGKKPGGEKKIPKWLQKGLNKKK